LGLTQDKGYRLREQGKLEGMEQERQRIIEMLLKQGVSQRVINNISKLPIKKNAKRNIPEINE